MWKQIPDYPNYFVNQEGQIKAMTRKGTTLLRPSFTSKGYAVVSLCKHGKSKSHLVHRVVATTLLLNPNNLPQVNHISGDKTDNSVTNLEWCTQEYNAYHRTHIIKTQVRGADVHTSKLSPKLVAKIKQEYNKTGITQTEIGRRYGISQQQVSHIVNGKSW